MEKIAADLYDSGKLRFFINAGLKIVARLVK